MKSKKLQLIRIGLLGTALSAVVLTQNLLPKTAYAVGDLTVDWGTAVSGDPIFEVTNLSPGDCETQTVTVTNDAALNREVGVRGDLTTDANGLSSVLEIEIISSDAGPVYGPETLEQFFLDSDNPNAITLQTQAPSQEVDYDFTVCFDEGAGNEFQNASVVFDLTIGVVIPTPDECLEMDLPNVIFGTSGNDRVKGTHGNDLIFLLEGNDRADGGGGDDCIVGGEGNDRIEDSTGKDVILGEGGNDKIDAGSNDDLVLGGQGNDELEGGSGNDIVKGENGNDKIDGGSGNDDIEGNDGEDNIKGGSGNDLIHGGLLNDLIDGGSGLDQLFGDEGHDNIKGGSENDLLDGGAGGGTLNGESGTDTCVNGAPMIKCEL